MISKIKYTAIFIILIVVNIIRINNVYADAPSPVKYVQQDFDVLNYDVFLNLSKAPYTQMSGVCKITFKWLTKNDSSRFVYHLVSLKADSIFYGNIKINSQPVGNPDSNDFHFEIFPPANDNSNTVLLTIYYSGTMTAEKSDYSWGGVHSSGTSLYSLGVGFLNNYVSMARHWMPCFDLPWDKATFHASIAVPEGMFAASNGRLDSVTAYEGVPLINNKPGIVKEYDNSVKYDKILTAELVSFDGSIINYHPVLTWKTASEINLQKFEIERKILGSSSSFSKIGEVPALGTSSTEKDYGPFVDSTAEFSKLNQYRLKMVDKDGSFEYSQTLSLAMPDKPVPIIVYNWTQEQPCATYLLTFAVDNYEPVNFSNNDLPMVVYGKAADTIKIRKVFKLLPKMVALYESLLVKFPFDKVGYAITGLGAMEHQTLISYPQLTLNQFNLSNDTSNSIAAHELAHQWFGDLITCRDFRDAWLNEGFAEFYECVWMEHLYDYNYYLSYLGNKIDEYLNTDSKNEGVFPLYDFPRIKPSSNYPWTIYHKGAAVVGMLRFYLDKLQPGTFNKCVKQYISDHYNSVATTVSMKNSFAGVFPSYLDWFINQWVYGKGWPELDIDIDTLSNSDKIILRVRQVQPQSFGGYTMVPLDIVIEDNNGNKKQEFEYLIESDQTNVYNKPASGVKSISFNKGGLVRSLLKITNVSYSSIEGSFDEQLSITGLYPVPADNFLNCSVNASPGPVNVEIFDILGINMFTMIIQSSGENNAFTIGTESFPSGIYFIKISQNQYSTVKKILINH